MLDFAGNIFVIAPLIIAAFVLMIFFFMPIKTSFDKVLKSFLGIVLLALLFISFLSYRWQIRQEGEYIEEYKNEIVGNYLLDKVDSGLEDPLAELPDSIVLGLFNDGKYSISCKLNCLDSSGSWKISIDNEMTPIFSIVPNKGRAKAEMFGSSIYFYNSRISCNNKRIVFRKNYE